MRGNRRLQSAILALSAVLLFGTLNAAGGIAVAATGQPPGRPDAVAAAANTAAVVTAPGAFDTRLLGEARPETGRRGSRHDGASTAGASGAAPGPSRLGTAFAVERSVRPERRSGTGLRGPPRLPD
jgi:hypothetical protein